MLNESKEGKLSAVLSFQAVIFFAVRNYTLERALVFTLMFDEVLYKDVKSVR